MNDDPNDPYTYQHRLNMFAGDIQQVFRKHVDNSASITWVEAVELLRQIAAQVEYDHTVWPEPPDYGPDYDPQE